MVKENRGEKGKLSTKSELSHSYWYCIRPWLAIFFHSFHVVSLIPCFYSGLFSFTFYI